MRNLIFISVDDNSNIDLWFKPERTYDLIIHYSGNKNLNELNWFEKLAENDKYFKKSDWKFNVLNDLYKSGGITFENYDFIAVFDGDGVIPPENISKLFENMAEYDLFIGSPSYTKDSKSLYNIMTGIEWTKVRFTNFVGHRFPIFKKQILCDILADYTNFSYGYGFDYFYGSKYLDYSDKIAIFDEILIFHPELKRNDVDNNVDDIRKSHEKMVKQKLYKHYAARVYSFKDVNDIFHDVEYIKQFNFQEYILIDGELVIKSTFKKVEQNL